MGLLDEDHGQIVWGVEKAFSRLSSRSRPLGGDSRRVGSNRSFGSFGNPHLPRGNDNHGKPGFLPSSDAPGVCPRLDYTRNFYILDIRMPSS